MCISLKSLAAAAVVASALANGLIHGQNEEKGTRARAPRSEGLLEAAHGPLELARRDATRCRVEVDARIHRDARKDVGAGRTVPAEAAQRPCLLRIFPVMDREGAAVAVASNLRGSARTGRRFSIQAMNPEHKTYSKLKVPCVRPGHTT
jgi:hypothetical protein